MFDKDERNEFLWPPTEIVYRSKPYKSLIRPHFFGWRIKQTHTVNNNTIVCCFSTFVEFIVLMLHSVFRFKSSFCSFCLPLDNFFFSFNFFLYTIIYSYGFVCTTIMVIALSLATTNYTFWWKKHFFFFLNMQYVIITFVFLLTRCCCCCFFHEKNDIFVYSCVYREVGSANNWHQYQR